jgi:ribose transport system permease protein
MGNLGSRIRENIIFYLSYVILGVLFLWMCTVPGFLTVENLYILLQRVVQLGFLSIGMTLVILTGGIDLSVGSILALACALTGQFQHWGTSAGYHGAGSFIAPELMILFMILGIGALVGVINGFTSGIGIPDFAVTLGTMIGIRGAAYAVTGGVQIFGLGPITKNIAQGSIGNVPYVFFIFILIFALVLLMEKNTIMGKSIYAVGENPRVAILSGISYLETKLLVYILSGVFAAMAGWILAGRMDIGDPKVGTGVELDAIAAVIIGGTSLYGGYGGIVHTFSGVLIIVLGQNLMALYGVSPNVRIILIALILLIYLTVQKIIKR